MSDLFEDSIHQDRYFGFTQDASGKSLTQLRVLEWSSGRSDICADEILSSPSELFARDEGADSQLRIVLAPSESSFRSPEERNALRQLFEHYDVPSAFVSEFSTSPTYSFGARRGLKDHNVQVAWTRFLCKDILPNPGFVAEGPHMFYDNFLWIKCLAYLHVRQKEGELRCVTMLCFGANVAVEQRFERLLGAEAWMDAVDEPYILFALVYEQLFFALDKAAWSLAGWFRPLERSTLDRSRSEASGVDELGPVDFGKLHEIAKHGIYLSEAATAAVLEAESLISHLRNALARFEMNELSRTTIAKLEYQKAAFTSTKLRLSSLDKRIANVIGLSFNLVTQRDSQLLKHDSNAMKAIALLTLVFLPMTGVASLFDTPFFEAAGGRIEVASSFWIFWVVTVCLTLVMIVSWLWWYKRVKQGMINALPEKSFR